MSDLAGLEAFQQIRHDVFLSYSWDSGAVARRVYEALSGPPKVFFAPVDIPPEAQAQARFQFADLLMDGVARSGCFLGLLSRQYLESAWCQLEMHGFFNVLKRDRARRMWLFELEPCRDDVAARLRDLTVTGDEASMIETVRRGVSAGARRKGYDLGATAEPCLRQLPLREMYRPPRRAPWKFESQSRGLPGAPPYEVYEALVREYMVQIRRGRDPGRLDIPMEGVHERYEYLSRRAREDAEFLLGRRVDPFSDRKPYSEICVELMFLMGEHGETEHELRGMAECRSYMGPESFPEAIDIAQRAIGVGVEPSSYRRIRARAHYGLREYRAAIDVIATDSGTRFLEDHLVLAAAHARLGELEKARAAAGAALALEPRFNRADERIETAREDSADIEHWLEGLEQAGVP